ncbi:uncharacterized protein LOC131319515 isoform X2 [Rhododendron vialii]|uniref:uncharacterized protein LOC131319515 isoform X2 n=1 Tax=Rhododendron vialii TaxID=182163 RepID=UPI00265FDEC4|nr:uncharacterized protein LOC131319515 isoform X2 [Rhododendron vialii]
MRIRKRFLLSSLSSLPLSDPQLNRSSPLQLLVQQQPQQESNTRSQPSDSFPNPPPSQPSDGNLLIRSAKASWVSSSRPKDVEGEVAEEEGEKSNDTKKGNILGSGLLQETGSSHQEVGRWCEGDKVLVPLPPKKRRGSFETRGGDNETEKETKKKKTKGKMKSKTNKKCVQLLPNGDDQEMNEGNTGHSDDGAIKKRKAKRGNVIMEGSRCSRVNGRGWRCCQQTLVGYSLCEHHLGKGRLRSIASVRNHAVATTTIAPKEDESSQLSTFAGKLGQKVVDEEDEDEDNDDEEEKPLMMTKKRMKIGMVKARSISSLLGQTNNVAVVVGNDNDKKMSSTVM